jgi:hypothetical protein
VILPGLKDIPNEAGRALKEFVQGGGGLLMFLGEEISANRYNSEFRGLLPVQLASVEVAPGEAVGWRIGEFRTNAGAFAVFNLPESGDLAIPQFFKRYALTPAAGASPMAFLEDGMPLIIAGAVGRGQVALVNSSADTSWNDWPKHKTFVPWLHSLGKQLASQTRNPKPESPKAEGRPKSEIRIRPSEFGLPSGFDLRVSDLGQSPSDAWEPLKPGIYSVQDEKGLELRRVAVNLPPQESDLAAMPPLEFRQQLARVDEPPRISPAAFLFGSKPGAKEFWRLLLLGVLGLLLMETLVSNRTSA